MNKMDTSNIEKMKQGTMKSFFGMMFVKTNEGRLTLELMPTAAPAFLQFFRGGSECESNQFEQASGVPYKPIEFVSEAVNALRPHHIKNLIPDAQSYCQKHGAIQS